MGSWSLALPEHDPVPRPVATFHALETEIDEFAVLLDAENPEGQQRRRYIEEHRALLPRAEPLAYGPVLVIVTHDGLGVRSKPGDRGIDHDEQRVGHFTAAECDLRWIGHLRQHMERRRHAV